jgi:hypothetical protein
MLKNYYVRSYPKLPTAQVWSQIIKIQGLNATQ